MTLKGKVHIVEQKAFDELDERWKASRPKVGYTVIGTRRIVREVYKVERQEVYVVSILATGHNKSLHRLVYDAKTLNKVDEKDSTPLSNDGTELYVERV